MEIAQIDAFLEAARRGSFRRAAEGLHLSQPSISARVQSLEQELGGPLCHHIPSPNPLPVASLYPSNAPYWW